MFIRKQCLTLSKNWNTPVGYWMDMPLSQLCRWIDANNELIRETETE